MNEYLEALQVTAALLKLENDEQLILIKHTCDEIKTPKI